MRLAIRHFPDKKKPCIVLEEGNKALVLGYLTDRKREKWLRMALGVPNPWQIAIRLEDCSYTLDEITESEESEW